MLGFALMQLHYGLHPVFKSTSPNSRPLDFLLYLLSTFYCLLCSSKSMIHFELMTVEYQSVSKFHVHCLHRNVEFPSTIPWLIWGVPAQLSPWLLGQRWVEHIGVCLFLLIYLSTLSTESHCSYVKLLPGRCFYLPSLYPEWADPRFPWAHLPAVGVGDEPFNLNVLCATED